MVCVEQENRLGSAMAAKAASRAHSRVREGKPVLSNVTNSHIDSVVESVENAAKRLSQHSQLSNSSKKRVENKIGPWRLGRTLGKGSTGRVRLGKHAKTGMLAAIKIIPKLQGKHSLPYGIEREIIIMKLISHPNIMGLYDVWENDSELYLVLEYVQGGELFDFIISNGKLSEAEAVKYFKMIINGVSYCHKFNICHRDLKPENILMDKDGTIKIADFGMAALETNQRLLETSCGSPHYASPEIVTGKNYHGSPSDVWSCGVILFALLTGHLPFDDKSIRNLLLKVQSGKFHMPQSLSMEAKDLIWCMLRVNPKHRIPIDRIMTHPLLLKYPSQQSQMENTNDKLLQKLQSVDLSHPVRDIDSDILHNLQTLWHGTPKSRIILMLKMDTQNNEKMFYYLLENYKLNHMGKIPSGMSIKKSKSQLIATLPRSTSTVKTVIEDENGEVVQSVVQEFTSLPPAKGKRKLKPIVASSSKKSLSSSTLSIINMNQRLSSRPNLKTESSSSLQEVQPKPQTSGNPSEAEVGKTGELNEFKYLVNSIFESPKKASTQSTASSVSDNGEKLTKLELLKLDLKAQKPPSVSGLKRVKSSSTRKLSNYLETPNTSLDDYNELSKNEKHNRNDSIDSSYLNLSYSFHQGIQVQMKSPKGEEIVKFDQRDVEVSTNNGSVYIDAPSKLSVISETNTPVIPQQQTFQAAVTTPFEKMTSGSALSRGDQQGPKNSNPSSYTPTVPIKKTKHASWLQKFIVVIRESALKGVDRFRTYGTTQLRVKKEYWLESDCVSGTQMLGEIKTNPKFREFTVRKSRKDGSQRILVLRNKTSKMTLRVDILDKVGNDLGFTGCFVSLKLISGPVKKFDHLCMVMNSCLQLLDDNE